MSLADLSDWFLAQLPLYGPALLGITTFLSCLALPVPSSLMMIAAGAFVASGDLSLPMVAATAYAIAAVTVSLLTRTDTPQSMVVWFLAIMAVGAGLAAIPGWVPLRWEHAALILGMGLAGAFGQIALTSAFMRGDASMIAPLEYTGLVWVIAWDWLLWQTLPDTATWTGAAIIVASGLYLLRRERTVGATRTPPLDQP